MSNNFAKKSKDFLKSKGYYIVLALCILTIGAISFISYKSARNIWSSKKIDPATNLKETTDVSSTKTDVKETSKPKDNVTKKTPEVKEKAYVMPLNGKILTKFSPETPIYNETLGDWRCHMGIDIIATLGTDVKAINDGIVEKIDTDNLLGVSVTIKHTDGKISVYSNLDEDISVKEGQSVNQNDVIGKVGQTSISESSLEPHLHFEIISDNKNISPEKICK